MRDIPVSGRLIEEQKKRKKYRIRVSVLFLLLFVSVIFALSFYSHHKNLVINEIEIEGVNIINENELRLFIDQKLSGNYVYLFARDNSFIYPKKEIYDGLIFNFPRIETLEIKKDGFNKLNINIKERVGVYLYCGETVPEEKTEIGENCYFINDTGYIFDKAPYYSGDIYFKYYLKLDSPNVLGSNLFDGDYFLQMTRFINSIKNLGFEPIYLVIDNNNTGHLHLAHGDLATQPEIIFKTNDDLEFLIENFTVSLKEKEFKNELESGYNKLLYLDLRFENKILYKFEK